MRAVMTSLGTTGDVQPFLGLANELQRHGHDAVLAMPPKYEARVKNAGFSYAPIGSALESSVWNEIGARQMILTDPIEQTRFYLNTVLPALPGMYRELLALCEQADVLISAPFQLAARMVYDATRLPFVSVHLSPFGSGGNKALRAVSAPLVNPYRQQEGLPPLEDPLGADGASPQLALYAVSRFIFRPPAQWPPHYRITGYFFFEEESWQVDPALEAFVAAGDPPVVITFGSMPAAAPGEQVRLLLEAVEQANCRAVIQHRESELTEKSQLPASVYATGFIPHRWLFPRASCIVHHGGAGTTAAAFRAGVPTVVVPHLLDQPIWAEYARALGCAGAVIPHAQLTAERLSAAITKTVHGARYSRSAGQMRQQLDNENGIQTACRFIEQMLQNAGSKRLEGVLQ
ncbi:MAG: glycosyltransferase [Chloroflexota bacterium]